MKDLRSSLPVIVALLLLGACGAGPEGGATTTAPATRAFAVERSSAPALLAAGESRLVSVTLRNSGSEPWSAGGPKAIRVAYRWEGPGTSGTGDPVALPSDVVAGALVDVVLPVVAPSAPGDYTLVWDVLQTGAPSLEAEAGERTVVAVRAPDARAEWSEVTPPALHADVEARVTVGLRNAGTVPWPVSGRGAVLLSYHWRDASGRVVAWDGDRTELRDAVFPGERTELDLRVTPPSRPGRYLLELDAVREGAGWFGGGPRLAVDVGAPSFASSLRLLAPVPKVTVGQATSVRLALTNAGKAPWPTAAGKKTRLAYHITDHNARVILFDGPRTDLGRRVDGGTTAELDAVVRAPEEPGRYKLTFELVQEGVAWFTSRGSPYLDVFLDVVGMDFRAHFSAVEAVTTMATGLTYTVRPSIINVGVATWPKEGFAPVKLGYHWLDASGGAIVWDPPRTDLEKDVAPGESFSASVGVVAPTKPGKHTLVIDLVQEGVAWFGAKGTQVARLPITVAEPAFRAIWSEVTLPERVRAGAIVRVGVRVRNDGPFPWPMAGEHPVRLAHHWRDEAGQLVAWDGFRSELTADVQPGEEIALEAWFFGPVKAGRYTLELDVVQEGVTWFADRGSSPVRATVEVLP